MWFFALAGSAVVPSLLLFWYIHSRDVHPEPRGMLVATFSLGAATAVPVLVVVFTLAAFVSPPPTLWAGAIWKAFVQAAIPEEGFKFLVLMTFCYRSRHFDEPFDGVVYGATASLGFATLENILYVAQGGIGVAIMRALTAVPGHAFTGVVMGYFVGRAKFASSGRAGRAIQGLLFATLLHGLYDLFLMTGTIWFVLSAPVLLLEIILGVVLIRRMRVDGFIPPRGVSVLAPATAGAGYPPATAGSGYPVATPGSGYPAATPGSGYPVATPGSGYPVATPGSGCPVATPGSGYPAATPGSGYPVATPGSGYPAATPGSGYPAATAGSGYPAATPGSGYPAATPGSGYPAAPPGSGYPAATHGKGAPYPQVGGGGELQRRVRVGRVVFGALAATVCGLLALAGVGGLLVQGEEELGLALGFLVVGLVGLVGSVLLFSSGLGRFRAAPARP